MNRDTELTAFLLRYLHDNKYFRSMEEMANEFDISRRHVQRLINSADTLKGGSIALSKILQYFGLHRIPFDPILIQFIGDAVRRDEDRMIRLEKPYLRLCLPRPDNLTEEGTSAYEYCREFVGLASSYVCPDCREWCDPWDGTEKMHGRQCFIAQLSRTLLKSVADAYTEEV